MPPSLNRIIKRTLQNEYRRQSQKRTGVAKPVVAAVVTGPGTASVGGQAAAAAGMGDASGSLVAVTNIGRPANAVYAPARATGIVYAKPAAFGGGNGGGGSATFLGLDDVTASGWDNGEVPTYNAATGKFDPALPSGGSGGPTYAQGNGILISGTTISVKPNAVKAIVVETAGVGVHTATTSGLRTNAIDGVYLFRKSLSALHVDNTGVSVDLRSTSGMNIDANGLAVGKGDGITVLATTVAVNASEIINPDKGLQIVNGDIEVSLTPGVAAGGVNSGLGFGGQGGLYIGEGDGIDVLPDSIAVDVTEIIAPNYGLIDDGNNNIRVHLRAANAGIGYDDGSGAGGDQGALYIGEGDGIDINGAVVKVNVVELISPLVYGMGHDGSNNLVVLLEPDSGLDYHPVSGRLMLGLPGTLDTNSINTLVDDTHYHEVLSSSNPGATSKILETDVYGGLFLDTNLLYVDAANNRVGINTVPLNEWGAATLDLFAANPADHTQRIKQMIGQTGRMWRIENAAGEELIVLDSVGNLQSGKPGFVSGLTGWQITPQGNAEFNNIWARGELHATVFVKDEIHATGGTFLVATAATFYEDVTLSDSQVVEDELWVVSTATGDGPLEIVTTSPSGTGNTLWVSGVANQIKLNHPPSGPATYFQSGEILRVKTEIYDHDNPVYDNEGKIVRLADVWLVVNSSSVEEDYGLYDVTKVGGSNCVIPKGTAIVTYGRPGDGAILMTSDWRDASGDEGYAPYIDVFTTGAEPWLADDQGITPHVRMGQLKGVGLPGFSGISKFGIIMGEDLANPNSAYMGASDRGIEIYRGNIRLNNGANDTGLWDADGNFKLGKNISQPATTGFEVVTTGDDAGDVWIGDRVANTNYLHWDAEGGILVVKGSLLVEGGGGGVDEGYVYEQDEIYLGKAAAETTRQIGLIDTDGSAYADSRRIVAINAVFTSSAYNVIGWAAFSVFFANGTTRPVAGVTSFPLPGLASVTRYWMYVDLDQAGTLTLNFAETAAAVNQPSFVLLGVVTKGASGPPEQVAYSRATVTVVAGSTYISGASIFTGSILTNSLAAEAVTANEIRSGTITASRISGSVFDTIDNQKVKAIYGTIVPTPYVPPNGVKNEVKWSQGPTNIIEVVLANDKKVTVLAGTKQIPDNYPRQYAYVVTNLNNTTPVTNYTLQWFRPNSTDILPKDAVVIAVVTAGVGTATPSCTVTMTHGGVTISGGDLVAQSIAANKIVANSITANEINASFYGTIMPEITDDIAPSIKSTMAAITVSSVNGKLLSSSVTPYRISWPALTIYFADDTSRTVPASVSPHFNFAAGSAATARAYFYIVTTEPSGTALHATESITTIPANSVIIAVAEKGTDFSTVTMTYGGVVISGNSIVAGSVTASEIATGTITADKVEADFFISNSSRIVAVNPKITPTATLGLISWNQLAVRFGEGTDRTVPAGTHDMGTNGRAYFYILRGESNSVPLHAVATLSAVPANAILLALAEKGTVKSSVTMVYGGVLISGDSIVAESITANQIAATTITANKVASDFFVTNNNSQDKEHAAFVTARLIPSPSAYNVVTWNPFKVRFKDGTERDIPGGSKTMSAKTYFYTLTTDAAGTGLRARNYSEGVPATAILIAVGDPGLAAGGHASVTMVNGGVFISGDSIVAKSITAGELNVDKLSALEATTGPLTVDGRLLMGDKGIIEVATDGKIYSTGTLTPNTAVEGGGFFLGYDDATTPAGYKFYIGEFQDFLRYTPGNGLAFGSQNALLLTSHGFDVDTGAAAVKGTKVFEFQRTEADTDQKVISLWHALTGIRVNGDWEFLATVKVAETLQAEMVNVNLAPGTAAADYNAITFTKNGLTQALRYNDDGGGRLNWMSPAGMKLNGPLWVSGNGSLTVDGKVFKLGMSSENDFMTPNVTGEAGNICITPSNIYICIATNTWRRIGYETFVGGP